MGTRRRTRTERGAAFIEFILVVPFFLFLIFSLISYGAMFSFRQTLSQAATEGARAAAVAPANLNFAARRDRAIAAINQAFQGELGDAVSCGTELTCTIPTVPTSCADSGQCISVTLTYAYADTAKVDDYVKGKKDPVGQSGDRAVVEKLANEILTAIEKEPLYYTDVAERFRKYDFRTVASALGYLHETERLWQDPRGKMCVRGSKFAAILPAKK